MNEKSSKIAALLFTITLLSIFAFAKPASAFISINSLNTFTTSDTNAASVAIGDVNGDGLNEIVTAGYYNTGTNWVAQVSVYNSATLALELSRSWNSGTDTQVLSVSIGNVTGSHALEIVTGGSYFNGAHWIAQMVVWNGSTLAVEGVREWLFGTDTQVSSVAIGNVTGSHALEIVTGGSYTLGTSRIAQMVVWNGSTLITEGIREWLFGTNTSISSVAIGNVTGSHALEIVTGGSYIVGTSEIAQMVVWNGSTLITEGIREWLFGTGTSISSVAIGNVTGSHALEIVTGGSYTVGTSQIAQMVVWNGSTLITEGIREWLWGTSTQVNSVAIGNFTQSSSLDIVTGGLYNDGVRNNGQIVDWNGATLVTNNNIATWFTSSDTQVNSVTIGNTGVGNRVIECGQFWDFTRSEAQIIIWG